MVALTDAQTAAVLSFMSSKRGTRKLIDSTVTKMTAHFKAEGMTLQELPIATPPTVQEKEVWVDEWKEYAVDAGVTHTANINNVGRWIESDEHTGVGARSGKASAVADALHWELTTLVSNEGCYNRSGCNNPPKRLQPYKGGCNNLTRGLYVGYTVLRNCA